ncbi:MAG: DUF3987 domain-containing protein [Thermoguttaceae bacterium]|nr:DUF3987 domain-containing protein [Thermoguttaceae bacterium]
MDKNKLPFTDSKLLTAGKEYLRNGLCALPTNPEKLKAPFGYWTKYQTERPTEQELQTLFSNAGGGCGIGLVCGKVSGGLEVIDFDNGASEYQKWKEKIPPELFQRLTIERTPHGRHLYYRAPNIEKNRKLAKTKDDKTVLIETRGQGGFIAAAPGNGYELEQGGFDSIPTLTADERDLLITTAEQFDQREKKPPKQEKKPERSRREYNGESPAESYVRQTDVLDLMHTYGWGNDKPAADGNIHLTRPGKDGGTSGTVKDIDGVQVFYPFTTSTGFEANRGYNAFQIYAICEHAGDQSKAARELLKKGYGSRNADKETAAAETSDSDEFTLEGERSPNRRRADEIVPFPIEALPRECQDYILDIATTQGQDPAPIAAVLLAQVAGTIGGSVRLLAGFNWYIPPVLWLGIIGISGGGKSPILDNVESLLSDVSWEFHKKFKSEEKEYDVKMRRWQKRQKDPTADPTPPPIEPIERKIYTTDATFEGFVKDNLGSGCRTPLLLDELVTFFAMLHRTNTAGEEAKWLAGYNGGGVRTSRATSKEVYIERAYWGIWGGSTPEKFRNYLEAGGGDKDGTLSRFCFVWIPDSENDPHTYNAETGEFLADDPVIKEHFRRMKMITETIIKGISEGAELRLCSDAMRLWDKRVTDYKGRVKGALGEDTDAECAFISKSTELPIRIAIVIHALKAAREFCEKGEWKENEMEIPPTFLFELPPIVPLETYREAESIALWLEGEGLDNYRRFGFLESSEKTERRKIFLCIANAGADGISERGIYTQLQQFRTKTGRPKLQKALIELEEQKRISKKDVKPIKGRPTTIYYVTPAE